MPKSFPRYIIDRASRDKDGRHPNNYLFCYHKTLACVCEIVRLYDDYQQRKDNSVANLPELEVTEYFMDDKHGNGGYWIQCVEHLYDFEWSEKLQSDMRLLLKHALEQYIYRNKGNY